MANVAGMSFNLTPTLEICCNNPEHRLMRIEGRDTASREFITNWRFWCPDCQALSMTLFAADEAMHNLEPGAIGFVTQAPLNLSVGFLP